MKIRLADIQKVENNPTEPVTLAQAKSHMRVDFTDDDAYITSLITQARQSIEDFCNISIVTKTITAYFTYSGGDQYTFNTFNRSFIDSAYYIRPFELPFGPVTAFTSLTTLDFENNSQVLDPTNNDYYVRGAQFQTLEIVNQINGNSAAIYNTGYTTVPGNLVLAILHEIAFRFENRGDSTNRYAQQNVGLSESANYLASPYKRYAWQ